MTKFTQFLKKWGLLILVLGAAVAVRAWRMEFLPFQSDADELAFVFAGQSLWEQGRPISWSSFSYDEQLLLEPVYLGDPKFRAAGSFTFVRPWFDHPFLLSLMLGGISELFGYTFPSIPPSLLIRIPMVLLSGVTLLFVYLIAAELFDKKSGLLALAIAGFSPVLILGQRMAVGENLYIPLILIGLYLVIKNFGPAASLKKSGNWRKIWLMLLGPALLAAAAGASKMTGLVGIPLISLYLILEKKYRPAIIFTLTAIGIWASVYFLYGALIDWPQFLLAMTKQSYRLVGWSNPAFILAHPGFHHFIVYDLSYYLILILGWLGISKAKGNSQKFMLFSTLGLMALVWLSSAEQDNLGWYKLPLFTFLSIATAGAFSDLKKSLLIPTSLVWLTVVNNLGLVRFFPHNLPEPMNLRLVIVAMLLLLFTPYLLSIKKKNFAANWTQIILIVGLVLYATQAIHFADQYYFSFCQHQDCAVPFWQTTTLLKSLW